MKPRACGLVTTFLLLLAISMSCTSSTRAQRMFAQPGELPPIDAAIRGAIVDSICAAIDSIYVDQEGAERIVVFLKAELARGAYEELTDPVELAQRLEQDAQTTHHDNHFGIRAMLPLDPSAAEQVDNPRETQAFLRRQRERNYGFQKVEILPGNIGYLQLNEFAHIEGTDAAEAAIAAMNFLANTHALIIDLRQNGGGAASMIRLLASYLFDERVHLINWYERAIDETVQSYTLDHVPGRRLADVPVYVLTSRFTGSAAEEFTFDLKNLERATVVGDTTAGAGNTVASEFFSFDGFRMGIRLPYGRAYNPENGEGWEGVGVRPDIAVSSDRALLAARADALTTLRAAATEEDTRFALEWALADVEAELDPVELTPSQLEQYVGRYGPRRIILDDDGALYYQREDRPRHRLAPMGDDLFQVGDLDNFRLEFQRDAGGHVNKVLGVYGNGRRDENERTAD